MRFAVMLLLINAIAVSGAPGPALAGPTPEMLVEVADFTGLSASPDGRFVAFRVQRASIERNGYMSDWYVLPVDGGEDAKRVADGGEPLRLGGYPVTETPQWSPDSRRLYFRALHNGSVQIWSVRRNGGGVRQVTSDAADIEAFSLVDDNRLVYEVGATREEIRSAEIREYDTGILIDRTVPVGRPLFRSGFINGRLASERYTGEWLATADLLADAERRYMTVDLRSGAAREATADQIASFKAKRDGGAPELASEMRARGFQASNGRIAYRTADGAELRARLDGAESSERICAHPACASVSWFSWAPRTEKIVFASRDRARSGVQSLYVWDVSADAVRLVLTSDGSLNGGEYFDPASRCAVAIEVAICVAAEANRPPRLEKIDLSSGKRETLFEPNRDLAGASGPPAERLTWRSADGTAFSGHYLPAAGAASGESFPLFITYYACAGYLRGGVGDEWPLAALAASGIAVLCISAPQNDDPSAVADYRTALSGIKAAIEILAARGVDRRKVGMGGFSFGAEVTMWTIMNSDLLAAASIATPSLSETYYWRRAIAGEAFTSSLEKRWGLGAPSETPEQWKRVAVQHNLDQIDAPLLMQFPEQEYLSAIDYFAPLARRGAAVEMYAFPHEPHYKFLPRHKLAVYERNLDWFRFWLQGYVDPDPAKAEQYARWTEFKSANAVRPGTP